MSKLIHRKLVEKVLGKPLPPEAIIHHVDENPFNNDPSNLVVCPDRAYHSLLHARMRAVKACGNPSFRPCVVCGNYDDPENMEAKTRGKGTDYFHSACQTRQWLEWKEKRLERLRKDAAERQQG